MIDQEELVEHAVRALYVYAEMTDITDHNIHISLTTDYPWDGKIKVGVNPKKSIEFTIKLRIPGWARNEVLPGNLYYYLSKNMDKATLSINGEEIEAQSENGYFTIARKWSEGDELNLEFPMKVQITKADERVEDDRGKSSFEFGPLVYCVEEVDNPKGLENLNLSSHMSWDVEKKDNLLGGINIIKGVNRKDNSSLVAVPYYSWSNRGVGAMKVWIQYQH